MSNLAAVKLVTLFDVDNTLLDNDQVTADLKLHLQEAVGPDCEAQYWMCFEDLRKERGYADYLGALQRFREENPRDPDFLRISSYLLNYPFQDRVYAGSRDAIRHARHFGETGILSDGDVVFQPWKLIRSGLFEAVDKVLIYIHKEQELETVHEEYRADRYVMVDDKIRILHAMKLVWGERLKTVFVRQGHYALDALLVAQYPAADATIESIADLAKVDLSA